MICLALTRKTLEENLREIERYKKYLDLCELRADCLEEWDTDALNTLPRKAGLPMVFSLRRSEDGGFWKGSEEERCAQIAEVLSSDYAFVDLEKGSATDSVAGIARQRGIRIIRSFHDPDGVPADLPELVRNLPADEDEIPRLVVNPRSVADLRLILRVLRESSGPRIIQAMGKWGFPARILSGAYGSLFSLVFPEGSQEDPVPLSPETLDDIYRYRSLSKASTVYGIIGNPVLHSRSPLIHNSGYKKQSLDAVYLPFLVDNLDEFFALADDLSVRGFSVTIPYKSVVIPHLVGFSNEVSALGACNTVVRTPRGYAG